MVECRSLVVADLEAGIDEIGGEWKGTGVLDNCGSSSSCGRWWWERWTKRARVSKHVQIKADADARMQIMHPDRVNCKGKCRTKLMKYWLTVYNAYQQHCRAESN